MIVLILFVDESWEAKMFSPLILDRQTDMKQNFLGLTPRVGLRNFSCFKQHEQIANYIIFLFSGATWQETF